ncbi:MAG: membrane protein insertase YidC [Gemmataceae bacterium]
MQPTQPQQPAPAGNLLVFFLLVLLIMLSYSQFQAWMYPNANKRPDSPEDVKSVKERQNYQLPVSLPPTAEPDLITLGDKGCTLRVVLDPRGAGVRQVTLNRFKASDVDGRPTDQPLDLVPAEANRDEPSNLLYHCEPGTDRPVDVLGRTRWKAHEDEPGRKVTFTATASGLRFTKIYTLEPNQYHVGLEVKIERPEEEKTAARVRYQLTGAKGLPVEGKWFTHKFRNAIIGLEDEYGTPTRDFQDLAHISLWGNGSEIRHTPTSFLRYAATETQYFAHAIVVDENQDRTFLASARPTLERAVFHGQLVSRPSGNFDRFQVISKDGRSTQTFFVREEDRERFREEMDKPGPVAVVYRFLGYDPELKAAPRLALDLRVGDAALGTHALWEDDIVLRVNTKPVDLEPGSSLTHRYLLYNGPVKPKLLAYLRGENKVDPELVSLYVDKLHLYTLTDYQSPGFFGNLFYYTGLTWLIITITNWIHILLGLLYYWIPNLGVCILLLTVVVRGLMYPLSRKQAVMAIKMQALAPQMKELQEKHKDDRMAMQQAQWELFRKHGVNPLGTCWVLLLQMPIFMGLWFALQESITFRLTDFWPTWIVNLAAPDMLWHWGRGIPFISRDMDYGSLLYLGPYLNVLPIIAVVFMVIQQQMMTPPPADEQQEMQQKMMKYMMIIFGVLFYKVAAGLCVYYIATTLWGFAERAMLPKAKLHPDASPAASAQLAASAGPLPETAVAVTNSSKKKAKKRAKADAKPQPEAPPTGLAKWREDWSRWWNDILEQARKK